MADLIKLGGLWKNKGKSGVDFLSGKLSPSVSILIFVNKYKQPGDNQPTHIMYLSPVETDAARGGEQGDSFMAGSDNAPTEDSENAVDDFTSAPATSPRQPAQRPVAPAPQTRTMNAQSTNTRPAGDVRPATNGAPAPPNRRPAPAPQADDIGDFEDPFGD